MKLTAMESHVTSDPWPSKLSYFEFDYIHSTTAKWIVLC